MSVKVKFVRVGRLIRDVETKIVIFHGKSINEAKRESRSIQKSHGAGSVSVER